MKKGHLVVVLAVVSIAAIAILAHRARASVRVPALEKPLPPPTVDPAAYNAKMLQLANLPPQTDCAPARRRLEPRPGRQTERKNRRRTLPAPARSSAIAIHPAAYAGKQSASRLKTIGRRKPARRPRPCPAPLWPVHTVLPQAGALLPFKRIVTYYGNFYSRQMGILGQYPPAQVIARLRAQAAAWARADPSTPVELALDYIAVSAQQAPGRSGRYRMRMPGGQIDKALRMARQIHGLLFLDVQPGWSTVQAEVPPLAKYLQQPNVELALDPEFALIRGKRPGKYRGTLNAAAINFAARFLAKLVARNHLPPKLLVIHRFTQRMVTGSGRIRPLPQVEIVMDMDGFGSPAEKISAYRDFIERRPVQFTGFKLFYKNDVKWGGHLMTPAEVLRLSPRPSFILYQ